jgi:ribonuclease R
VGRKNRRTYMLGDSVEVVIEKVDPLRHQIDLDGVLPEGEVDIEPVDGEPVDRDHAGDNGNAQDAD